MTVESVERYFTSPKVSASTGGGAEGWRRLAPRQPPPPPVRRDLFGDFTVARAAPTGAVIVCVYAPGVERRKTPKAWVR